MIDDNYSDDMMNDNFEEEYVDDLVEETHKNIKNDFWDPPKNTTQPSNILNQKNNPLGNVNILTSNNINTVKATINSTE